MICLLEYPRPFALLFEVVALPLLFPDFIQIDVSLFFLLTDAAF